MGGKSPEGNKAGEDEVYEKAGIRIKLIKTSTSEYRAKAQAMLAAGDQIDMIYLNWDQYDTLVVDNPGLFIQFDDLILNSKVFLDKSNFPDIKAFEPGRKPDGHMYGVVYEGEGGRPDKFTPYGPIIRWDWIEKLGMVEWATQKAYVEDALTFDDFYKILRAFAYDDPGGNVKQDTYGIAFGHTLYDATPFFGTLGLQRLYQKDKNDKIYTPWTTDAAAPILEFFARLYREKILEPNFVTNGSSAMRANFMSNTGMIV